MAQVEESEFSVGELEDDQRCDIKIVYANPKLRFFRARNSLAMAESNAHLHDLLEMRDVRKELERTDKDYCEWLKEWRDH